MKDQPWRQEAAALLDAWIALEALSPRTFRQRADLADGDASCVAPLSDDDVPWLMPGERPRRDHKLFYHIVLGEIRMDLAMAELIRVFGDDEELPRREREKAVIAGILVDAHGHVVGDDGIAVSSFAWAFPLVQALQLRAVGEWGSAERRLVEELRRIVSRVDEEDRPVPLDLRVIQRARDWLLSELRLPKELVEAAPFVVRVHHHVRARNSPEPLLLNSFFLEDLAQVSRLLRDNKAGALYVDTSVKCGRRRLSICWSIGPSSNECWRQLRFPPLAGPYRGATRWCSFSKRRSMPRERNWQAPKASSR